MPSKVGGMVHIEKKTHAPWLHSAKRDRGGEEKAQRKREHFQTSAAFSVLIKGKARGRRPLFSRDAWWDHVPWSARDFPGVYVLSQ